MDGAEPSQATTPVVFLRNLPQNTSERDVAAACSIYGTVQRLYMVPMKQMAFIQFDSVASAQRAVHSSASQPLKIHDRPLQFTPSDKTEVTGQFSEAPFSDTPVVVSRIPPRERRTVRREPAFERPERDALPPARDRRVILVQLVNLTESVSMDEFYTVFAYFGTVVRMSYFIMQQQNRLLVEYENHESAARAQAVLRNCDIGICEFSVEWSRLPALTFSQIDKKNRDYSLLAPVKPTDRAARAREAVARAAQEHGERRGDRTQSDAREDTHGATIRRDDDGRGRRGPTQGGRREGGPRGRRVLFVSGLPETLGAPQLLRLFGQYGDVELVRVLYGKADQALVEMGTVEGAHIARDQLDEVAILGSHLRVSSSKHDTLNQPVPGSEDADLCAGPLTRASTATRIVSPGATLHVSNIVAEVAESEATRGQLRDRLTRFGAIEAEEWMPPTAGNTRWMGRFRMDSVEAAVACVAFLHRTTLLDRSVSPQQPMLKVAFAVRQVSHAAGEGDGE